MQIQAEASQKGTSLRTWPHRPVARRPLPDASAPGGGGAPKNDRQQRAALSRSQKTPGPKRKKNIEKNLPDDVLSGSLEPKRGSRQPPNCQGAGRLRTLIEESLPAENTGDRNLIMSETIRPKTNKEKHTRGGA